MVKKQKFNFLVLFAMLVFIPCIALFAGCKDDTINSLKNNKTGIELKGGDFKQGSVLNVDNIEAASEQGQTAISKISNLDYKKSGQIVMYDIYVSKNNQKIQPSKKVQLTLNAPFESNSYVIFHIKENGNVENLKVTNVDNKLSFETDSFSVFIVAEEDEMFFLFELEMDKVDDTDANIKTVAFYSTRETDGKTELLRTKIDGSFDNNNNNGIYAYDTGLLIMSGTCYKDCVVGTRNQKQGNVYGFYTYDGTFKGKISINQHYKLFYVENDTNILTEVTTNNFQTLKEGRYFVVRQTTYNQAIKDGKDKTTQELYLYLLNLSQPHDDGNGNVVFDDITASYELWIQFDSTIKSW